MRIIGVKPHPNSPEHCVVVFETKVRHELQISAAEKNNMDEISKDVILYLKGYVREDGVKVVGYEDIYPETKEDVQAY